MTQHFLDDTGLFTLWNKIKAWAAQKSHTHDERYPDKQHTHDERYYTKEKFDGFQVVIPVFQYRESTQWGLKLTTSIPAHQKVMPTIKVIGYAYLSSANIDLSIVSYYLNGDFCNLGVTSCGSWSPTHVFIDEENGNRVFYLQCITYFPTFTVAAMKGTAAATIYDGGWTLEHQATAPTLSSMGKEVPFKPLVGSPATPIAHDHNSSYYTKSETDGKLTRKSDTGHSHAIGDITSLTDALASRALLQHTHTAEEIDYRDGDNVKDGLDNILNTISDLATIRTNAAAGAAASTALNGYRISVVGNLPTNPDSHTIYFIAGA